MKENCIICNLPNIKFVRSRGGYDIIQCLTCGLTYSSPMKSQEDYSQEITHGRWEFNFVVDLVERLLNKKIGNTIKVFEVGCGDGRFLHKLRYFGCECYGNDINPNGIAKAKKFGLENVFNTTLTGDFSKRFEKKFDIVFSFHVIEHVDNLKDFILNLNKILKPGGFLILSVPNPERLSARLFSETWDYPSYHLTKWSQKSISFFLENNGFKIENIIEEPLTIESKYIYIVDTRIAIVNILQRFRKTKILNSHLKNNAISKPVKEEDGKIKNFFRSLIAVASYILGHTIYFSLAFLKTIKILPKRLNKGLSLVVIAEKLGVSND